MFRVDESPKPMQTSRDLTDDQWATFHVLIPEPPRRKDGRGRPWKAPRTVLNGILWVLRTGAPWSDLSWWCLHRHTKYGQKILN